MWWPWLVAAPRCLPPDPPAAWACGTSWRTTSVRISPRWPCRCSSTSRSTPSRGCVKSWSTVSCWTSLTRPLTHTSAWWVEWKIDTNPERVRYTPGLFFPTTSWPHMKWVVHPVWFSFQVYVAAFAISAYASTYYRAGSKPFNPVLGETYECDRPDKNFRFIAEQVETTWFTPRQSLRGSRLLWLYLTKPLKTNSATFWL